MKLYFSSYLKALQLVAPKKVESSEKITAESTEINSVSHICLFEIACQFSYQNVRSWTVYQISDDFCLNLSITKLMDIPNDGCLNHKLNLDINDMFAKDFRRKHTLDSIYRTMNEC